ncbi:UPF0172-domain-containing protein [Linderina pennispora]|uniref:UPF0172-domain-containing protein n=1 Tax=Linderina pennispora TaxID=61395 RepID=A0A1Y1WFC6_9FUNG|nr:UPF0172-domain-containing protein [Linderina pennispora]ORX72018.1 UPF0172-domain-containing protein [Linderina pennispora]
MSEYVVSTRAYAKAILHCAKFPSETVHGLLLTEKKDGKIRIVDAVPVSHNWTQLTPMFDVALQQVRIYAKSQQLAVGGYYVAYEDPTDVQLSASGALLAKAVVSANEDAVAFVIDAKNLSPEASKAAFVPFVYSEAQWKEQSGAFGDTVVKGSKGASFVLENMQVLATTKKLVAERAEIGLVDFDEHMDNVTLDWIQNATLNERIRTA